MKRKHKAGLKPGDKATVFKLITFKRPAREGRVTLLERVPGVEHLWLVKFDGEEQVRRRFVNPHWQKDPDATLAALTAAWRASIWWEVASDLLLETHHGHAAGHSQGG